MALCCCVVLLFLFCVGVFVSVFLLSCVPVLLCGVVLRCCVNVLLLVLFVLVSACFVGMRTCCVLGWCFAVVLYARCLSTSSCVVCVFLCVCLVCVVVVCGIVLLFHVRV